MNKIFIYDINLRDYFDLYDFGNIRTVDSYSLMHLVDLNEGLSHWATTVEAEFSILNATKENSCKVASMIPSLANSRDNLGFIAIWNSENLQEANFIAEYNSCFISNSLQEIKNKLKEIITRNEY